VLLGSIFMEAIHDFGVLVITMYLNRSGGLKFIVTDIPCVIMLIITNWAMVNTRRFFLPGGTGFSPQSEPEFLCWHFG